MKFSELAKAHRAKNKWSRKETAFLFNMGYNAYLHVEQGKKISLEDALIVLRGFKIPYTELSKITFN